MNYLKQITLKPVAALSVVLVMLAVSPVVAQDQPPLLAPAQLDSLVSRIALYPDPLLSQVLAAATFTDQIPDAAGWSNDHANLAGDQLADAISQANLPWDPSVQSLLPFPNVLNMMASDMNWTGELGNAVLGQRPDVMDAVQRMRLEAQRYGYLQTNPQERVIVDSGYVQILPVNPAFVYVPVYDPFVVFAPPRPGFFVGGAITFGRGFVIGGSFVNWGWGGYFDWRAHNFFFNHVVWNRTWVNRGVYVHNWGGWNGGRYPHYAPTRIVNNVNINRNVTVNRNVDVNRNAFVNRNTTVNNQFNTQNRNVYHGNQPYSVTPNRGYESHEQEHSGAFHGTENGNREHAAAQWGRDSRGGGGGQRRR